MIISYIPAINTENNKNHTTTRLTTSNTIYLTICANYIAYYIHNHNNTN